MIQTITPKKRRSTVFRPSIGNWWAPIIVVSIVMVAIVIAYQPVMFNFFTSDDFYMLSQLDAAKQGSLWLIQGLESVTPYYRPLFYVVLFFEYVLFGTNSCWFRITNLSCEVLSSLVLGFLLCELTANGKDSDQKNLIVRWSSFTAGLFLLYPLHTEPINWIATQEVSANLLLLLSFLLYILWRKEKKVAYELSSCIVAACAFLLKESTVVLPLILLSYELIISRHTYQSNLNSFRPIKFQLKLPTSILVTSAHWLLLAGYLIFRRVMTGYFFGNPCNMTFHFPDNQTMFRSWLQSLKTIIIPVSSAVFNHNHPAYCIWMLLVFSLAALTIAALIRQQRHFFLATFIAVWFFICLLPFLKCLTIGSDLMNDRYGYLATVPLCAFLTYGLAFYAGSKAFYYLRYPTILLILGLSCFTLRANNLAWAETGALTNNLLEGFRKIHRELFGDVRIYFVNIPNENKGVILSGLNCIESMNHFPFSKANFNNGIWLQKYDQSLPIGIMKHALEQGGVWAYFYYWDAKEQHFTWINPYRKKVLAVFDNDRATILQTKINGKDQSFHIISQLGAPEIIPGNRPILLFHPKQLACWPVDLIVLKVKVHGGNFNKIKKEPSVNLCFTNSVQEQSDSMDQLSIPFNPNQCDQTIIFPLRGIPIWSFGGLCNTIRVSFPKGCAVTINTGL